VTAAIACIVGDWGTTNLRAWVMGADGTTLDQRCSPRGLMAVEGGRFSEALEEVCSDWLASRQRLPVVMSGMVGSKLGWKEAPYLTPHWLASIVWRDISATTASRDCDSLIAGTLVGNEKEPLRGVRGSLSIWRGGLLVPRRVSSRHLDRHRDGVPLPTEQQVNDWPCAGLYSQPRQETVTAARSLP
jgi:hypothetical protein